MPNQQKKNINVFVNRRLAEEFRKTAQGYSNRLGMCFSAAMLMFLEADPKVQGEYLTKVFKAEIEGEVEMVLAAAKEEQARRIAAREQSEKTKKK